MPEEEKEQIKEEVKIEAGRKKSGNTLIILVSVVIGILLLSFAATKLIGLAGSKVAQQVAEKAIEQSTGADVDISGEGEEVTVKTEEGTFTAGKQEVPENFPDNIPLYPGSEIETSASSEQVISLSLTSQDSFTAIADYYKKNLIEAGWKITEESSLSNAAVLSFENGEQSGVIAITETEDGSSMTISIDLGAEE